MFSAKKVLDTSRVLKYNFILCIRFNLISARVRYDRDLNPAYLG